MVEEYEEAEMILQKEIETIRTRIKEEKEPTLIYKPIEIVKPTVKQYQLETKKNK
jgi:prefoldin subunit 5